MDILKRNLAPFSQQAWAMIDDRAVQMLSANLSARKVVDVDGPKGWDFPSVPLGRLENLEPQPVPDIQIGLQTVLPLLEARIPFSLDIAELDNIARGAKDIDFSGLDQAAQKLAAFEDSAVYHGLAAVGIKGLKQVCAHKPVAITKETEDLIEKVSQALTTLRKASIQGPYAMVVSPELWVALSGHVKGYPLYSYLETMLTGPVVVAPEVTEAYLLTTRGGDMKMSIGQDIAIGFAGAKDGQADLFFVETFTFMVIDPTAFIVFEYA